MAEHPTVSRAHITGISDKLKDWWERTLDQKALTPEQAGQLLRDLGFGLNDCLAYIEQQDNKAPVVNDEAVSRAHVHYRERANSCHLDVMREAIEVYLGLREGKLS